MFVNATTVEQLTAVNLLHCGYSVPYIILLILPFLQGEVQSGYSKRTYSFINQKLLACMWRQPGYVRQVHAMTSCSSI